MGRYSKFHGNYILKKRHQSTILGNIYERDWVTVGAEHRLEKGKKPIYSDSNFLFTVNSIPNRSRKHNYGQEVAKWTYDDVKDSSPKSNEVRVCDYSRDIRDYAYYGSAEELVRASVLDIIDRFPPVVYGSLDMPTVRTIDEVGHGVILGYVVYNPFNINLTTKLSDDQLKQYNPLHFPLNTALEDYCLVANINGVTDVKEIKSYVVENGVSLNCVPYNWYPPEGDINKRSPQPENRTDGRPLYTITITVDGREYKIFGYMSEGEPLLLTMTPRFTLMPKKDYYDAFFKNLKGFESTLLNLTTNPKYTANLLTMDRGPEDLTYTYRYCNYTWPSFTVDGIEYPIIDVDSSSFSDYVGKLTDMAHTFDEEWCDNLYSNMTHESIKNFDWTYTKEFAEGEEEENVEGGNRMKHLLRWIGRVFDDVKHDIDGIGYTNEITYGGECNIDDAELTDKLTDTGWFITSTVPNAYTADNVAVSMADVSLSDDIVKGDVKWFPTRDYTHLKETDVDIDFMKRLFLSSAEIWKSKGTMEAIDMVMAMFGFGCDDYSLKEEYYTTTPLSYDGKDLGTDMTNGEYLEAIQRNIGSRDDLYDGIPLGYMYKESERKGATPPEDADGLYLVPMMEQDKHYDGDLYFQSKGGWGLHAIKKTDECYTDEYGTSEYLETLSYLRTASDIDEMLNADYSSLNVGDFFYVENLDSYYDYDEDPNAETRNVCPTGKDDCKAISHFFKLVDEFYHDEFKGWKNVNCQNYSDADEYKSDLARIEYLASIISMSDGNNPHVGYGQYDDGEDFKLNMQKPFKYAYDNYMIDDSDVIDVAGKDWFELKEVEEGEEEFNPGEKRDEDRETVFPKVINGETLFPKVINEVKENEGGEEVEEPYYVNSKVLTFTWKLKQTDATNDDKVTVNFKNYFFEKMVPYLIQVIPSTTILKFNFNDGDNS